MAADFGGNFAGNNKPDLFNPNDHQDNLLEDFNKYVSTFHYTYDAVAKDSPATAQEEADKEMWHEVNKRKIFLGRHS